MSSIKDRLVEMGACHEAVAWADPYQDPAFAWAECQRGDWMLWVLGRLSVDREDLVLAACECARLALPHARGPEALAAIEAAEGWAAGRVVMDDLRCAYAFAAFADAANAAASSAAYAANAAFAYAANVASYASYAAYDACAAARESTLATCADIVRRHFPTDKFLAIWGPA